MRFILDTEKLEDIELMLSEKDYENEAPDIIYDFCYSIASFYICFAKAIGCDSSRASGLKKVCLPCIEKAIDIIIEKGVAGENTDDTVSEKELEKMITCMKECDFAEDEILEIVTLVRECGGLDAAIKFLAAIVEESDVDIDFDTDDG